MRMRTYRDWIVPPMAVFAGIALVATRDLDLRDGGRILPPLNLHLTGFSAVMIGSAMIAGGIWWGICTWRSWRAEIDPDG